MRRAGVDELDGWGTFRDAHTIALTADDGSETVVAFDACIVATGAAPAVLPGAALGARVTTYERQILDEELPKSLVIVGGGAVGVELGYVQAAYGAEVTIVERDAHLLPHEDEEVAAELEKSFRRMGIRVLTRTAVTAVEASDAAVHVGLGEQEPLTTERVLLALGFVPRIEGYGLEATGVRVERGAIVVDDDMQTNVPGIYAVGDVTAKLMLAHAAMAMGARAAEHAVARRAGRDDRRPPLDFEMMPRAVYANPQVASFGLTEPKARERGHDVQVARFPLLANGKANAALATNGFVKLLHDRRSGALLGGHLVGHDVTELLPELTLARANGLGAEAIARNVHAHPTTSEVLGEAALGLLGRALHA
jgi:dihydrolipoamide dehydrogenase